MKKDAVYWIEELGMTEHPEGGYFKETYRSSESLQTAQLPDRYETPRQLGTSIYFLLTQERVSNFHRLNSDEIWHFHTGGAGRIHFIHPDGRYEYKDIGASPADAQSFQVIIPRHSWFAAEVIEGEYILVGCTVAPGFDFADFELANCDGLTEAHPPLADLIGRFTAG